LQNILKFGLLEFLGLTFKTGFSEPLSSPGGNRVGLDQRGYSTLVPVSPGIGDSLSTQRATQIGLAYYFLFSNLMTWKVLHLCWTLQNTRWSYSLL